jgi:hypothetical protein
MDSGNWEEEMETNDALPFCSSTSQGKLDFPLLHSVVTGSCYLVILGQGLTDFLPPSSLPSFLKYVCMYYAYNVLYECIPAHRRGHQNPLQMVVSHHVLAGN